METLQLSQVAILSSIHVKYNQAHDICRLFAISPKVVTPQIIICRCVSFVEFVAPQQGNHHCMSLPFVEEGETSEDPTQSIHNIVMTTEEAVNEVLIRQIY